MVGQLVEMVVEWIQHHEEVQNEKLDEEVVDMDISSPSEMDHFNWNLFEMVVVNLAIPVTFRMCHLNGNYWN